MKDKSKRRLLITAGGLLCAALIFGIGTHLSGGTQAVDPMPDSTPQISPTPSQVVKITVPPPSETPTVKVEIDGTKDTPDSVKPGAGADSSGTEQTIQAAPTKPEPPAPPTDAGKDHDGESVPESERNAPTPPSYPPETTTVTTPPKTSKPNNGAPPGFENAPDGGATQIIQGQSDGDINKAVGSMD